MNKLTADELRNTYLEFFKSKGHAVISGASVIPENDPTVLFTTAGMHPLVPYLLGQPHPAGHRLTDVQRCVRTGDIDSVGDAAHLTFFEMLGNWSLGDYFKKEAIAWSFEFLTTKLGFDPKQLYVTVFAGEGDIPRDDEAIEIWKSHGLPADHIFPLPKEDNWWGPAGETGPCGPDTEMFIDTGKPKCGPNCRPGCPCGKYVEIWNDVFMQFNKTADGKYVPLAQKNVDTGMGVERTVRMLADVPTVFDTGVFKPLMDAITALSTTKPADPAQELKAKRIIADHMRTAVFILCDPKGSVKPGNIGAPYVLRRLIRRAVRFSRILGIAPGFTPKLAEVISKQYAHVYPELGTNLPVAVRELAAEEERFNKTLDEGAKMFAKVAEQLKAHNQNQISGKTAFKLYDTYGFPLEMTIELAQEQGLVVDKAGFDEANKKHQELSRTTSAGTFKAGLQDHSEVITRMHTATHLLHAALHKVLGPTALQKGSNITSERLRFDFSWPDKMTPEQIKQVEDLVNADIKAAIPVTKTMETLDAAKKEGATALFSSKYGEQVSVYTIGDVSKEVCCGPHVTNTSELGSFKILKEQSCAAGIRRIKAVIGNMK